MAGTPLQFVWEEKQFTRWAEQELAKRLLAVVIVEQTGKTTEASIGDVSVTGDCSVCISMGKKMGLFDLSVKCKWSGQINKTPKEHGELLIPELVTEDVASDEYEINVTGDGLVAALMREKGIPLVRQQVHKFMAALMVAKTGDGAIRLEQKRKQNEGVEVIVVESSKESAGQSSSSPRIQPSISAKKIAAGPARNVDVTVHVSDIDQKSVTSERYRFFKEYTLLDTDTIAGAAEKCTSSIVDQGWKCELFPSVILVGPANYEDATPRQICYMGSVKGFARGTYLPSRRTLGKCLKSLKGNTVRVSPLDPEYALESARNDAAAEEAAYKAKQADRIARREARRERREERRKKRRAQAAEKAAAEAVSTEDAPPPEAPAAAGEGGGNDVYSWGAPQQVLHRPCTIELLDDSTATTGADKDQHAPVNSAATSESRGAAARSDDSVPTLMFE